MRAQRAYERNRRIDPLSQSRYWIDARGKLHTPTALSPAKNAGIHEIGGQVGARFGLDFFWGGKRKISWACWE